MKRALFLPIILLMSSAIMAQKPTMKNKTTKTTVKMTPSSSTLSLRTENDSISYAVGVSIANYIKSQNVAKINYKLLNDAIETTMQGKPALMNGEEANKCMNKLAQAKMQQDQEKMKERSVGEKIKGQQFLDENKKRPGITTTASGLQYEVLKKGEGPMPKASDTVVAHYAGSLIDGKEFDNSYKRGEPLTIPVGGVIRGWTEALQLMPVGSKWKLFIPSELGYGDTGAGQDIPGGATLVFEVELVGIGTPK